MNRQSVFQCSFGDGYAGSARMALYGCTALAKRGYDVTLLASEGSLTAARGQQEGIRTITFPTGRPFEEVAASINVAFETHRPQFFISYHSRDRKVGRWLRARHGKTFFNVADRQSISKGIPILSALQYHWYFDGIIACSRGVAQSISSSGILSRKMHTVHNAIDIPDNLAGMDGRPMRRQLGIEGNIVVGLSAWFHKERKGFDILFEALSKLDERFVLLLIGIPAPDQPRVTAFAAECGLPANRLVMPGFVDSVWEYYRAMNVFVLPSRSEGFSLALLEAAAAHCPIVASDIPGNDEFIRHGQNGLLFDVKRPMQLAEGIRKLADDASLAASCSSAAAREVREKYTLEEYGKNLSQVLEAISLEAEG